MRNNMLVPLKRIPNSIPEGPVERMRPRLERHTKYWPITISSTLMFNLKQVINVIVRRLASSLRGIKIIFLFSFSLLNRSKIRQTTIISVA